MVDSDVFYFPRLLPNGGLLAEGGGRLVWTEGEDQLMAQVSRSPSSPLPPSGGLVAEGGGRLVWTEGEDQLMAQFSRSLPSSCPQWWPGG
jgi:hypothetical protein